MADAAALAAAQSIDLPAYYADGATAATRLDVAGLPGRVRAHVARAGAPQGSSVDLVESDGRQVLVAMSSPLRLPFLSGLVTDRIRVESWAQLAYRAGVPEPGPYP